MLRPGLALAALLLGCASGPPEAAPTAAPVVSAPPASPVPKEESMSEQVARRWGAERLAVPADQVRVFELSDRAGDPIFGVVRIGAPKHVAPAPVLVRAGEPYAGEQGFAAWARTADRSDPVAIATAAGFLVFGSRGEPIGADPGDDEGYASPAFDGEGRLVFWYREPARSAAKQATIAFGPDGSPTITR